MNEGNLKLEDELKGVKKGLKTVEKRYFLNNRGYFFMQEKKNLIT